MNITTFKSVLLSSIFVLAMSSAIATITANAAEDIHNDATHDCVNKGVAASTDSAGKTERAEFAAFEKSSTPIPWEISGKNAW